MIKADYHTHSYFSGDSQTPTEEMIKKAIEIKLDTICFTEHYDYGFPYLKPEEEGMYELDVISYINKVDTLKKKYEDKISVLHGIELGVQPHIVDYLSDYVSRFPFDFIIASSHLCKGMDPYYPAYFEGRDTKTAIREYFEEILTNVRTFSGFDVYGHLDYVLRYVPDILREYKTSDYEELFREIFHTLIANGKGIEMNTGGLRQILKRTNPSPELIQIYKEMGGEIITVGSDAHNPKHIALEFATAEQILKEAGFRFYTTYKNRKPEFHPL